MKFISIALLIAVGCAVAMVAAPAEGQKSVVIVYGSRYGSTARTAEWIAEGMAGKAAVVAAGDAGDLGGYETIILGSGIYNGMVHADMAAFLEKRGAELKDKVVALFVVCGMPPDQAGEYLAMFAEKSQAKPMLARAFNGWMKKELLSAEDYKGLEEYYKGAGYPFESYDRTDKAKCLEFGKEILAKLGGKK
jgi:menaquinone-dependent protoporphyrinogen oxidase